MIQWHSHSELLKALYFDKSLNSGQIELDSEKWSCLWSISSMVAVINLQLMAAPAGS